MQFFKKLKNNKIKKISGFTLAEVLITLGIVGIVAVLTVPGVLKNYRNKMYVSQLRKVTVQLADAAEAIMHDEHTDNFKYTRASQESTDNTLGALYFFNNYLKIIHDNCAVTGAKNSCSVSVKNLNGTSLGTISGNCAQTINGAVVCGSLDSENSCFSVLIDVNGMAEPNTIGRDIFSVDIRNDGIISDYGSQCSPSSFGGAVSCGSGETNSLYSAAQGCFSSIVDNSWKMIY